MLGLSNVSFGLSPAARQLLNSVFLHECVQAGLDAAIVHAGKIQPLHKISDSDREICLDLIYDRRREGYDPLSALIAAFEGESAATHSAIEDRSGWPVERRLEQRIVDGDRNGLEAELDEALGAGHPALDIVNEMLLAGMRTVGELFGSGQMQLPFVLSSAETMKAAVAYLEPHMERTESGGRGRIVLGTVKGDVHDIGKNLVDIILTNNGYEVHNLGIKVPMSELLAKAEEVEADAIGMSGLLVKSTLIMRENLEELNRLGKSDYPVILGGAALTRTYVEKDLRSLYKGRVFYGKDAFEGLHLLDRLMEIKRSGVDDPSFGTELSGRKLPPRRSEQLAEHRPGNASGALAGSWARTTSCSSHRSSAPGSPRASRSTTSPLTSTRRRCSATSGATAPKPARATPSSKSGSAPSFGVVSTRPRPKGLLVPQVVWGYFPVNAEGNDLVVYKDDQRTTEAHAVQLPAPVQGRRTCASQTSSGQRTSQARDYAAFQIVTVGAKASTRTAELFAADRYRDYVVTHGLSVEMTEALAELWHRRVREEWGFADEDAPTLTGLFRQQHRGGRYSFGYPACPELEDNAKVVDLLDAGRIGVTVSEGFQLYPEQTTLAIICHHPMAKYFVV